MRITESYLRNLIKKELNEMDMQTLGTAALGGALGAGLIGGAYLLGVAAIKKIQAAKEKAYVTLEYVLDEYKKLEQKQLIDAQMAQQAMRVAELTAKHNDNQELRQLAQSGKLKEFAKKLEELEGTGEKFVSKGRLPSSPPRFSPVAKDLYKGMK